MTSPESDKVRVAYDAAITRIRCWALWSAVASVIGLLSWKVIVPLLGGALARWTFYASATSTVFGAAWFLVCLILLATYSHEKKKRLQGLR